jgi:AraC-like DNA-binding protein
MDGERVERPGSPLARSGKPRLYAERSLLSLFIESLAEAAPAATEPVEDISWMQVCRAEQWIDAHLTDAIGVDDVAAAIEVGVRSLQRSFKRVHGCSPPLPGHPGPSPQAARANIHRYFRSLLEQRRARLREVSGFDRHVGTPIIDRTGGRRTGAPRTRASSL